MTANQYRSVLDKQTLPDAFARRAQHRGHAVDAAVLGIMEIRSLTDGVDLLEREFFPRVLSIVGLVEVCVFDRLLLLHVRFFFLMGCRFSPGSMLYASSSHA